METLIKIAALAAMCSILVEGKIGYSDMLKRLQLLRGQDEAFENADVRGNSEAEGRKIKDKAYLLGEARARYYNPPHSNRNSFLKRLPENDGNVNTETEAADMGDKGASMGILEVEIEISLGQIKSALLTAGSEIENLIGHLKNKGQQFNSNEDGVGGIVPDDGSSEEQLPTFVEQARGLNDNECCLSNIRHSIDALTRLALKLDRGLLMVNEAEEKLISQEGEMSVESEEDMIEEPLETTPSPPTTESPESGGDVNEVRRKLGKELLAQELYEMIKKGK